MTMIRLLPAGFLVAVGLVACGGLLTSVHYALIVRVSLVAAMIAAACGLVIVVVRTVIARRRTNWFGAVVWTGAAAGLTTMAYLTRPGLTILVVCISVAVAVIPYLSQRSTRAPTVR